MSERAITSMRRWLLLFLLAILANQSVGGGALPKRLIVALDSIAYRDLKALQEGVTCFDGKGRPVFRQAFCEGYFPVSRMVSTFPSTSDVAWTEIFGNRPLPGYQRTYFSHAANHSVSVNGVTSSVDYEKQVTWRVESRFHFALSYVHPLREFRYEIDRMVEDFLNTTCSEENYYALILTTDSAQHMAADSFAMLCTLDRQLRDLRDRYQAREGRELEVLILSDHGNNHAGRGKRVAIKKCLKQAGYRIRPSIDRPKDVVLPTAGIESWVEIHNAPSETERLVQVLSHLEGVDVITARMPGKDNQFIVVNSSGERANIGWDEAKDALSYKPVIGDPIQYLPVVEALRRKGQMDSEGFAPADAWMAATLTHRYPVALERIVRGHTRVTLNPATILISLDNNHVHAGWLVKAASGLMKFGGTHGALDDLNSTGFLLSSFAPTQDTTSSRVAALYDGFPGLHDHRVKTQGAEWITGNAQALTAISRGPLDWSHHRLPSDETFLHIWTPRFGPDNRDASVEITIEKIRPAFSENTHRSDPEPRRSGLMRFILNSPVPFPGDSSYERIYALPPGLVLEPRDKYRITGRLRSGDKNERLFTFSFVTDGRGQPLAF